MAQLGSALIVGVGASRGLGAALARRFSRGGHPVVVAGRTKEKVESVAAEIRAAGGRASAVVGDASSEADVETFVAAAEAVAPLAAAIHNAGSNRRDPFLELSTEHFTQLWREHTLGGFLLGRTAARAMVPRGAGTILFTGASGSLRGRAEYAAFVAAKAGLRSVGQCMAREFGPKGVHVATVIIDGGILGDRLLSRVPDLADKRGPDGLLDIEVIAESFWQIHVQPRSAWTQELDLRPWAESF